ncbi:MAG: hypothetical protein WBA76_13710 [Phormidesmis sp.]
MASSSVSTRPAARSGRREHSQPALWTVACISFALGAAASGLVIWQLNKLYQATVAPLVTVEGTLKAQYSYQDGESLSPPPGGYYIEVPGVERVYLTGRQPLEPYVGQAVVASGSVSGVCGPKALPCYTQLAVREISNAQAEE